MKTVKLMSTAMLVASVFVLMSFLASPAYAGESVSCPTAISVPIGGHTTFTCTANWTSNTQGAQTASIACTAPSPCPDWSATIAPSSGWGSGTSGAQTLTVTVNGPASVAACTTNNDCSATFTITTGNGSGVGYVSAHATVSASTPEFGLGVASVLAVGGLAILGLRKRKMWSAPATSAI